MSFTSSFTTEAKRLLIRSHWNSTDTQRRRRRRRRHKTDYDVCHNRSIENPLTMRRRNDIATATATLCHRLKWPPDQILCACVVQWIQSEISDKIVATSENKIKINSGEYAISVVSVQKVISVIAFKNLLKMATSYKCISWFGLFIMLAVHRHNYGE